MLGKLIKHEWKAVWKFLTIIYSIMLGLTAVGAFGIFSLNQAASRGNNLTGLLTFLYVMTYIFCIFGVSLATQIYLGIRYYKSMYGDEGYLTHTLPATPLQLIASKGIVAMIWLWIYSILMIISIASLLLCANAVAGFPLGMADISDGIRNFVETARSAGISLLGYIIMYSILLIIGSIANIFKIYGAAAMGQLFDKHRILSAVGIYFGLTMVIQFFSSLVAGIITFTAITTDDMLMISNLSTWFSLVLNILLAVGCFLLTYLLTKQKLNLE